MIHCSIGICIFNEEKNIRKLLDTLRKQKLQSVVIDEIVVVSSGSTDKSNSIVTAYKKKHKRIKLVIQKKREGKSSAVNLFIKNAKNKILVLCGGDLLLPPTVIETLVLQFKNRSVGMVGAHPVPVNKKNDGFWGFAGVLMWELHHRIALRRPKMGELVAFRKVFHRIPTLYGLDEPNIEPLIRGQEFELRYVPQAIVYNRAPSNFQDFILQRRRNVSGQLALLHEMGYKVSTFHLPILLSTYFQFIMENRKPKYILYSFCLIALETYCRFLGWWDYMVAKRQHTIWEPIKSTKKL